MKNYSGFTLLELMIAITIVGILAALAVPAYQDYTIRAKVSESLSLASAAKFSVSEYYITHGELPDSAEDAGIDDVTTDYVASLSYALSESVGRIVMTFSDEMGGTANGKKIMLETEVDGGLLKWHCKPAAEDGPETKYLPSSCRGI